MRARRTVAAHLGNAFAEAGLRTLLVEADMRKPDLSRIFGVDGSDGLSLYLAGLVARRPRIHETVDPQPQHRPWRSGAAESGGLPALRTARARSCKAATADYQVVIVDTPPVLAVADARIIGTKADGVVLVVRAGGTARNLVRRARRAAAKHGVPTCSAWC